MSSIELVQPAEKIRKNLDEARREGQRLLEARLQEDLIEFRERYLTWERRTIAVLDAGFRSTGLMTTSPKDEFTGTTVSLWDLKVSMTVIPRDRLPEVMEDIREKIRVLQAVHEQLDICDGPSIATEMLSPSDTAPIFLVYGRGKERHEIVRRFLQKTTDRSVIVLAEQPDHGRYLLEKLLSNGQEVGFVVLLLTPDDAGGLSGEDPRPRARQNVVFELGFFIALLGRDRVAALNDPSVELPTAVSGVTYIPLQGDSWQIELARDLKAAGIAVSRDPALWITETRR